MDNIVKLIAAVANPRQQPHPYVGKAAELARALVQEGAHLSQEGGNVVASLGSMSTTAKTADEAKLALQIHIVKQLPDFNVVAAESSQIVSAHPVGTIVQKPSKWHENQTVSVFEHGHFAYRGRIRLIAPSGIFSIRRDEDQVEVEVDTSKSWIELRPH